MFFNIQVLTYLFHSSTHQSDFYKILAFILLIQFHILFLILFS